MCVCVCSFLRVAKWTVEPENQRSQASIQHGGKKQQHFNIFCSFSLHYELGLKTCCVLSFCGMFYFNCVLNFTLTLVFTEKCLFVVKVIHTVQVCAWISLKYSNLLRDKHKCCINCWESHIVSELKRWSSKCLQFRDEGQQWHVVYTAKGTLNDACVGTVRCALISRAAGQSGRVSEFVIISHKEIIFSHSHSHNTEPMLKGMVPTVVEKD